MKLSKKSNTKPELFYKPFSFDFWEIKPAMKLSKKSNTELFYKLSSFDFWEIIAFGDALAFEQRVQGGERLRNLLKKKRNGRVRYICGFEDIQLSKLFTLVDFSQNSVVEILQLVARSLMRRKKIETLRKHSRDGKMEEKNAGRRRRYMIL